MEKLIEEEPIEEERSEAFYYGDTVWALTDLETITDLEIVRNYFENADDDEIPEDIINYVKKNETFLKHTRKTWENYFEEQLAERRQKEW